MMKGNKGSSIRIFLIYLILGTIYILLSDLLVEKYASDLENLTRFQIIKGLVFIVLSGFLIFFLIRRETSKKNRLIETLGQQNRLYNTITSNLPHIDICLFDEDMNFILVNEGCRKHWGFPEKGYKGKSVDVLDISEEGREYLKDGFKRVLRNKRFEDLYAHDGRRYEIRGIPVTDTDGNFLSGLWVAINITHLKELEHELQISYDRLKGAELIASIGNWEFDFGSGMANVSEGTRKIYGLGSLKLPISEVQKIPLPEYRRMLDDAMDALRKNKQSYNVRFKIKTPDTGEIRNIHSIAEYDSRHDKVFGIIHDITELVQTTEKFRNYIESSPNPIGIINDKGLYTYANPAALKLFGLSMKELSEMTISSQSPEDYRKINYASFKRVLETGRLKSHETRVNSKNDGIRDIIVDAVRLNQQEIIGFFKDITELKKIQKDLEHRNIEYQKINIDLDRQIKEIERINSELKEAKEKAEESDRLKSSFLATMSHELRTPLNHIIGFSSIMGESEEINKDHRGYAMLILESGQQLLGIIEDVLEMAQIESDQLKVKNETCQLSELFLQNKAYLEDLSELTKSADLRLKFNAKPALLKKTIVTDRFKVNQLIRNLIKNAVKFTQSGTIEFGLKMQGEDVLVFFVKDTGIGIPESKKQLVFEKFRQLDDTHTRQYEGLGIGLALSSKIATLLGGKLWFTSEEGKGSTFFFSMKIDKEDEKDEEESAELFGEHIRGKVLIAEDDDSSALMLETFVRKNGLDVVVATNGKEALLIFRENKDFDLVFMDLKMPEMNGFDAAREIRKESDVPIIALSAFVFSEDREKAREAGCNEFIGKPVNLKDTKLILKKYLN